LQLGILRADPHPQRGLARETNPWDFNSMADVGRAATGPVPAAPEPDPDAPAATIDRALRAVSLRLRLQRALSGATGLALAGLVCAAAAICAAKLGLQPWARAGVALAVALPLLGAAAGALRRVDPLAAARLLDRDLGRSDLLASAWAFSRLPAAQRSAFMQACIRQADAHAERADPRRALPLHAPRALRPAVVLAVGVAALTWLDLSPPAKVAVVAPPKPRLLHQDDLSAFEKEVEPLLQAREIDPALRETAGELNALLEALHEGELDRAQALSELRALEKKLELSARGEDEAALREALRGLGRTLDRDALTQSVADAMEAGNAAAARAELERLASALQQQPPRAEALRKLAKTLERAATPAKAEDDAAEKARAELDRLLRKRAKDQVQPEDERSERLLRDKRRELDRLERDKQQREQAERKLDRLRRELSKASPPAQGNRAGEAGKQLERAAQELEQAQREQLTTEQREQLRERLAQLRELISKQKSQQQQAQRGNGQGQRSQGQGQRLDLDRFVGLSRGQGGKPGEDQEQQGGGKGKPAGKLLAPGGGDGEPDMMLQMPGTGRDPRATPGGEESAIAGTEAGQGGRPESGEQTRMQSSRVDTRVQGAQGSGATRSEVILEAGQRGFVSRGYERVHTDYERHAEAVLERDRVPGGYRFYVRRYFQLIRPREGQP
jgi:hypothetical protein